MNRGIKALATILCASIGARSVGAADTTAVVVPWQTPLVGAFLEAFDRHDDAAMEKAVTAADADPVAIAYGVWLSRLDSTKGSVDAETAARAVARLATFGPSRAEFESLVGTWIGHDEAARSREREVREFTESVARMRKAKAHDVVLAAIDAVPGFLSTSTKSPAAVTLHTFRLSAIQSLGTDVTPSDREFDDCLAAASALPWPESGARILEARSGFERRRGRLAESAGLLDRALVRSERLSPESRARLRWRRADALSRLRRFEEAIVESQASAELYRASGDIAAEAGVLGTEARAWRGMGRFAEATAAGGRSRQRALAAGNAREAARSLVLLALLSADAGRLGPGLSMLEQALAEAEPLGTAADDLVSHVLSNLGQAEMHVCHFDAAIVHLSRAVDIRRKARDVPGAMVAAFTLAYAMEGAGRSVDASRAMEAVAKEALDAGLSREQGRALVALSRFRIRDGDAEGALAAADGATAAFRDPRSQATPLDWAYADTRGAYALIRLGRIEEGLSRARAAVERSAGARESKRDGVRAAFALALLRSGDARAAVAECRGVLDARRMRASASGDADPEGLGLDVKSTTELGVRAALALPVDEVAEAAFPFIEAGRASILASALVQRDALLAARLPVALYAEERASRDAVSDAVEGFALASSGRGSKSSTEIETARAALDAADRRRTAAIARIGRAARGAIELLDPPGTSLTDARALLRESEAYVAFHVANDDVDRTIVAFVATKRGASVVDLGDAGQIFDKASAWIDVVSAPGSKEGTLAASLYDRLVRPLEPALSGVDRWLVSPDGDLSFLPWGALRRLDGESSERLVERAEITLVPSAGVLKFLRDQPSRGKGRGVLAVADPTPGPGGTVLPASREEITAICALHPEGARTVLVGDDATVDGLHTRLDASRGRLAVVHLATHGAFDPARPRMSGLLFAKGERLFFDDVASLRVDADLAVLSGCETAKGALRPGEGVLGLVRAFFLAGCPRVVASSWRVSDASTRELMVRFHERMTKDGLSPSAALRAAQIERLKAGGDAAHPYHWGAFQAWGLPE